MKNSGLGLARVRGSYRFLRAFFVSLVLCVLVSCSGNGSKQTSTSGSTGTSGTTTQNPPPSNPPPSNPPPSNPPPDNPPPSNPPPDNNPPPSNPPPDDNPPPVVKHGVVKGGVVPVSGATIQLYAAGSSDAGPSTPLIASPLLSDSSGEFDLAGAYTCPSADALVYVVAIGGDPGTGQANPQLNLMTVLGKCGDITATTNITINEVTTVAAAWSLAEFMHAADAVGASANNDAALAASFSMALLLANPATGTVPGANAPNDATLPVAEINTLADILASCVQSVGGTAGDGSVCGKLFDYTTPSGEAAPNSIITAALSLAKNPAQHAADLFALLPSPPPFQPVLTSAPASFALPTTFPSGLLVAPTTVSFDTVFLGDTSTKAITLTNQGSAPIQLTSVGISGSSAQEFSYALTSPQTPCSLSASLAGGATCTIVVELSPVSAGQKSADLQITSTAPNGLIHVPLSGQAQEVASGSVSFTISPDSLSFSKIGIPQTITVTNTGTVPFNLTITPYYPPSAYPTSTPVGQGWGQSDTCTQGPVAPAGSCTISAEVYGSDLPQYLTIQAHAGTDVVAQQVAVSMQFPQGGGSLSSRPIDFGTWAVGVTSIPQKITASSSQSVYILNQGVTGPNASEFAADCLSVKGTCSITFTPAAVGQRTATLHTQYGNIALSGSGQPAGPSMLVTQLSSFYTFTVGSYTEAGFRVVNNGTQTLTPAITLEPPTNTALFSIRSNAGECPSTLAPAVSCVLYVRFTPTQIGEQSATLQVKVASIPSLTVVKNLTATAAAPSSELILNPNPLEFGAVELNHSYSQQFPLTTLDMFTVGPATGGNASGDFTASLSSNCNLGTPYGGCYVQLGFVPSALGVRTTSFVITDQTTGKTGTLWVRGTSTQQAIQVSPDTVSFPATTVGTDSAMQTVTIRNNGYVNDILMPTFGGPNSGAFAVKGGTCDTTYSSFQLSPGQSCTLSIVFHPNVTGTANASLQIGGTNISIPVSGTGIASVIPSQLGFSATSLSFPDETVSYITDPQGLTITNTGQEAQDVTVQVLDSNGQVLQVRDFTVEGAAHCLGLQAGRSCRIGVGFLPNAAGVKNEMLRFLSLPSGSTSTVSLSGTGLAPTGGPLTLSPAEGLFFGQTGIPQTVTLTNSGDTPVEIKSINYENNTCPIMLQGQASCTIAVDGIHGAPSVRATSSTTAYTIPISLPPQAQSVPEYLGFGTVPIGSLTYAFFTVYLNELPQGYPVIGDNASDFIVWRCPAGMPHGECNTEVDFKPQGPGLRTALLETPFGGIKLYGVGGDSDGSDFTITQNNFPTTIVPGYVGTITLTNTGTAPLLLSRTDRQYPLNFSLSTVGTVGRGFRCYSGAQSTVYGINMAVGGSCTFEVSFDVDQNTGAKTENMTFTDAISGVSHSITFNGDAGVGVSAPTVSQSTVDVGNIAIGETSAPKTVTISAPSGDPVTTTLSRITNSATYVLDQGSCATQTPCQVTLKMTPTLPGPFSADVMTVDPVTGKSTYWFVTGAGGFPAAMFYPTSLDFGTQTKYQQSPAQSFQIINTGVTDLKITNFTMTGTGLGDYVVDRSCIGTSVPVGGSCAVSVSFLPVSTGLRTATLNIVSNAPTTPPGIQFSGTGQ